MLGVLLALESGAVDRVFGPTVVATALVTICWTMLICVWLMGNTLFLALLDVSLDPLGKRLDVHLLLYRNAYLAGLKAVQLPEDGLDQQQECLVEV